MLYLGAVGVPVSLILEDRLEDIKRGLPDDAIEETIAL